MSSPIDSLKQDLERFRKEIGLRIEKINATIKNADQKFSSKMGEYENIHSIASASVAKGDDIACLWCVIRLRDIRISHQTIYGPVEVSIAELKEYLKTMDQYSEYSISVISEISSPAFKNLDYCLHKHREYHRKIRDEFKTKCNHN